MSKKDLLLKIILPISFILVGIAVAALLIMARSAPQREERAYLGPLVDVIAAGRIERQIRVPGTGTVQATQVADITPQVSGQITSMSPRMVEGGFFTAGERLFSIDKIDYRLALERARANLAQAELELQRNQSLAEIARFEWERIERDGNRKPNPLTLYEPQLKAAAAQVAAARASVRQAELDLARTDIGAPFNCYVRAEQIDVGQYVRAGNRVATVAGTDEVEIVVPLPVEELLWLRVPREMSQDSGSAATVILETGEFRQEWPGRIVRSLGEIDPLNRMAKVVVAVADPFGRTGESGERRFGLKPGMFVDVILHGAELTGVIALPRGAVRDRDTVWIVGDDNRLQIRPVGIVHRGREEVLVDAGIEAGDRVVLTGITAAAEGMLLRPQLREDRP